MNAIRHATALLLILVAAACATSQPTPVTTTPTPQSSPAPSAAPSPSPSAAPSSAASLDPSLSDAGIVGRITITNDTRAGRNGMHDIVAVAADGSSCGVSFAGDELIAVAWYNDAPDGQLRQMGVSVPIGEVPSTDGEMKTGITDGGVSADFASSSGIGTQYSGNAADDERTSSTIAITRHGTGLTFDFTGSTWDSISFGGQLICAAAND